MITERLHFAFIESGIARGTLTEIYGPKGGGKTEAILNFIRSNPSLNVAWVEHIFTIYPTALNNAGLDLERILFVEAGREILWTALQIMRSGLFGIIALTPDRPLTAVEARRLQLEAEKSRCCVVMIMEHASSVAVWPISLRILVTRNENNELRLDVQRARGPNAEVQPKTQHRAVS